MTYPYWKYPKGAAKLVAANKGGPWAAMAQDPEDPKSGIAELAAGVTKDIFQENMPRVRDRVSIRQTRGFRKLGNIDMEVCDHQSWERVFRNYYGVPIRIHPAGEVIGILKVENKRGELGRLDAALREQLRGEPSGGVFESPPLHKGLPEHLKDKIFEEAAWASPTEDEESNRAPISLFALAYLERDLAQAWQPSTELMLRNLIFIPFPRPENISDQRYRTLRPNGKRPPVQVIMESLEVEQKMWNVVPKRSTLLKPLNRKYEDVKRFYDGLCMDLDSVGSYKTNDIANKVKQFFDAELRDQKPTVKCEYCRAKDYPGFPDFLYRVDINNAANQGEPVTIYLMIIPSPNELEKLSDSEIMTDWQRARYCAANRFWRGNDSKPNADDSVDLHGNLTGRRKGEYIEYEPRADDNDEKRLRVTDLLLDRLAARVQSFVDAIPIPPFSPEDARKLSWAAFEVGKLIEREISYRANYHPDDPMPLTAMEFFRIPISDLSFVDDLRTRRLNCHKIKANIDHRLNNMIGEIGLPANAVQYKSRIKNYRSALQRIGERYEGYRRGNLAIWFYVLACFIKRRPQEEFYADLKTFKDNVDREVLQSKKGQEQHIEKFPVIETFCTAHAGQVGDKGVFADLKFGAPPFDCDDKDNLKDILNRLACNLMRENLLGKARKPEQLREKPQEVMAFVDECSSEIEDLILRNYADFARAAVSLLVQLLNRVNEDLDNYAIFYRVCYELRNRFCAPLHEIRSDPGKRYLLKIFDVFKEPKIDETPVKTLEESVWRRLVHYVESTPTHEFVKAFSLARDNLLYMTERGIYKRLRAINNILAHQRSAAALDWDLGRFDLLGVRLNCLFKSQVFLAYETAWRRGDPFFRLNRDAKSSNQIEQDHKGKPLSPLDPRTRVRWLCLRTNVHAENYNALQITAVVDPESANEGYWSEMHRFNLKRVRAALGTLFDQYYPDPGIARKYKCLAYHRINMAQEYKAWHRNEQRITVPRAHTGAEQEAFVGFLWEGVLDVLIYALHDYKAPNLSAIMSLLNTVVKVLHGVRNGPNKLVDETFLKCNEFTTEGFTCVLVGDNKSCSPCGIKKNQERRCKLYDDAIELLSALANVENDPGQEDKKNEFARWGKDLYEESEIIKNRFGSSGKKVPSAAPLFFMSSIDESKIEEMTKRLDEWQQSSLPAKLRNFRDKDYCKWFLDQLTLLRREQKLYLFGRTTNKDDGSSKGLSLRLADEVLWRINNLALLFDPSDLEEKLVQERKKRVREEFGGLTSYDLYYYLRSLIPLEIQFRTALTDTVAEQYHGTIYKGAPPIGTVFTRKRIEAMGGSIDELDHELGIDYEDFINQSHRLERPNEPPGQSSTQGPGSKADGEEEK